MKMTQQSEERDMVTFEEERVTVVEGGLEDGGTFVEIKEEDHHRPRDTYK